MSPSPMKVVHVNDVAGVASAAVAQAQADGLDWTLWPLPQVRGRWVGAKLWIRLRDLVRFHRVGRGASILHIHYGHFAYYAWLVRRPYLLHLHGTDVRVNLRSRALGPLTRRAIRRAAAVVYSTPDMRDAVVALRPDATWLPAPLDPAVSAPGAAERPVDPAALARIGFAGPTDPMTPRIVFASRWDAVKGLPALLDAARTLRLFYRDADLVGIDWGEGAVPAAAAGVRLLPLLPPDEFRALLASADVVIGQLASGALGVADLTAMALERPLVARFTQTEAYDGDHAPLWNTATLAPLAAVAEILADPARAAERCQAAAAWARRHHGPQAFVAAAMDCYRTALGA